MIGAVLGMTIVLTMVLATGADTVAQDAIPARVTFASMDGRTKLVGYVSRPAKPAARPPW